MSWYNIEQLKKQMQNETDLARNTCMDADVKIALLEQENKRLEKENEELKDAIIKAKIKLNSVIKILHNL